MSEQESLLSRIEEKIRTLGERLVAASSENASLKEEINALNNKIADLEEIFDESNQHQNGMKADQVDTIKKELDKYITEVEHCIEMVKDM
jgi:chromosome segregation ATPase